MSLIKRVVELKFTVRCGNDSTEEDRAENNKHIFHAFKTCRRLIEELVEAAEMGYIIEKCTTSIREADEVLESKTKINLDTQL